MTVRARYAALVLLAAFAVPPSPAAAAPSGEVHVCVSASERGQRLREKLRFKEARDEFVSCARDACPAVVRTECAKWATDINERLPSIVVRATDAQGRDVTDVKVYVDETLAQERLDGRRVEVDPGPRVLRFERAGQEPKEMQILVREGEKNRFVDVVLGAAPAEKKKDEPPKAPAPAGRPFPVVAAALAGVAVLGGVGFGVFAASGSSDVNHLRETCAPHCARSDVDSAKTKIVIANVSLAVGVLALAGAGYFLFFAPSGPDGSAGATVGARF